MKRKEAEREIDNSINLVKMRINSNLSVKVLFLEGYDSGGYGEVWEEFFKYSFFSDYLEKFLLKIKTKINNL